MTYDCSHELCHCFFEESKIDDIGFWEIIASVDEKLPNDSKERKKEMVLSVICCLLVRGLTVFQYKPGSPERMVWTGESHAEILLLIENKWRELGRQPGLGDVCWLG